MTKHISLIKGDITKANLDAIVNAANPKMLGGGGVDGAIHRAAGPTLLDECRKVKSVNGIRCPYGEARITLAGNLLAKYVIHAVGPIYRQSNHSKQLLESAYYQALVLAKEHNCQSIAFPAISCGAYGYPLEAAAYIALNVCKKIEFESIDIYFYLLGDKIYQIWEQALYRSSSTQ